MDDLLQAIVADEPRQTLAQDREMWSALAASFIARVTCVAAAKIPEVPYGRHMLACNVEERT